MALLGVLAINIPPCNACICVHLAKQFPLRALTRNSHLPKAGLCVFVNVESTARCRWPRGPMDKASAYGVGDCRFESCRGHFWFLRLLVSPHQCCKALQSEPKKRSPLRGSNPRPYAYGAHALPTELRRRCQRSEQRQMNARAHWLLSGLPKRK